MKIEAKDLRHGNILKFTSERLTQDRSVVQAMDIAWAQNDPKQFNEIWKVIPLTEQWLLDFGFIENDTREDFWISSERNHLVYIYFEKKRDCFAMIYNGSQFCELKFVHQLQNLVFALTNEELKLKAK
jgi:hypothetical protein